MNLSNPSWNTTRYRCHDAMIQGHLGSHCHFVGPRLSRKVSTNKQSLQLVRCIKCVLAPGSARTLRYVFSARSTPHNSDVGAGTEAPCELEVENERAIQEALGSGRVLPPCPRGEPQLFAGYCSAMFFLESALGVSRKQVITPVSTYVRTLFERFLYCTRWVKNFFFLNKASIWSSKHVFRPRAVS